jgi:hypothetical protein
MIMKPCKRLVSTLKDEEGTTRALGNERIVKKKSFVTFMVDYTILKRTPLSN